MTGDIPFYLHLPILIVVTSLVTSATRSERWSRIVGMSLRSGLWLSMILVGVAVVLYLFQLFI
jgi:hypothetical protein